jgi:hypothetical protein
MEASIMRRGKKFILTNYLERGSKMAVITSRLFVSLGDWPRNPSFLWTSESYPQFSNGLCSVTLESNPHAYSIFM